MSTVPKLLLPFRSVDVWGISSSFGTMGTLSVTPATGPTTAGLLFKVWYCSGGFKSPAVDVDGLGVILLTVVLGNEDGRELRSVGFTIFSLDFNDP